MKLKEEEKSRRISSALLGSQGSLLVNAVFTAWKEMLSTLRTQNELERLREEHLALLPLPDIPRPTCSASTSSRSRSRFRRKMGLWRVA